MKVYCASCWMVGAMFAVLGVACGGHPAVFLAWMAADVLAAFLALAMLP